jgi:hypothetical protein
MNDWSKEIPPTLTRLFEPPPGHVGEFGWLCGYSADDYFLNNAVERFSRRIERNRAIEGRIWLGVMLDPSNPQISPNSVPGVLHLPYREPLEGRPFNLLHAKVALLGFRHLDRTHKGWQVRLLVSTGNWTRQTLDENLDLVFSTELNVEALPEETPDLARRCADIGAAWEMLVAVREWFDTGTLRASGPNRSNPTLEASKRLETELTRIKQAGRDVTPRFFENRRQGMLATLIKRVSYHGGSSKRNYLLMGSGFFDGEEQVKADQLPPTIEELINKLRAGNGDRPLLTQYPDVDIFVNPTSCQAIAKCSEALAEQQWSVRSAKDPKNQGRLLHAKFLFSANYRGNADSGSASWLFLGSSNLTRPGFIAKAGMSKGNLEAGVVLTPERLTDDELTNYLPVHWGETTPLEELQAGDPWEEASDEFLAPPVSCFRFVPEKDQGGWLEPLEEISEQFQVIVHDSTACVRNPKRGYYWPGKAPLMVMVEWTQGDHERRAEVPVMDHYGRLCAKPVGDLDLADTLEILAGFPAVFIDEELNENTPTLSEEENDGNGGSTGGGGYSADYPIRAAMRFIEQIADLQQGVTLEDWKHWCDRLEQYLVAARKSPAVAHCHKMGMDLLGPLWHPPFRPCYAVDGSTQEGRIYEDVLRKVSKAWGMGGLPKLGGEQ